MARNDPTAAALDRLSSLRNAPDSPEKTDELRSALRDKSNFVVARAAKIAGELKISTLTSDLLSAFERIFANPPKLDKGGAALTEIVSALYELDYIEPSVYFKSIHHVQMEASFGPPVDVAAKLRGIAAMGLARSREPQAMAEVVTVLADKEAPARLGAVRAIATNGGEAGMLLLRLKALTGDDEPEILGECFSGLLTHGDHAVPFVAQFADSEDDAVAETAVIALGASRLPAALDVLKQRWERSVGSTRKSLLNAIASNRSDEAADFLLSLLANESAATAQNVLLALASYRSNERIRSAAWKVISARHESSLLDTYRSEF